MWPDEGQGIKKQNSGEPLKIWGQQKQLEKIVNNMVTSFRIMKAEHLFLHHMFLGPGADSGPGMASFLRVRVFA